MPLTQSDGRAAAAAQSWVAAAVVRATTMVSTQPCDTGRCQAVPSGVPRPASGRLVVDAVALARALRDAGFPNATVRMARPGDPAPVGSVLYAVPVGSACILGYDQGGGGSVNVVGRLLGGRCLTG